MTAGRPMRTPAARGGRPGAAGRGGRRPPSRKPVCRCFYSSLFDEI